MGLLYIYTHMIYIYTHMIYIYMCMYNRKHTYLDIIPLFCYPSCALASASTGLRYLFAMEHG